MEICQPPYFLSCESPRSVVSLLCALSTGGGHPKPGSSKRREKRQKQGEGARLWQYLPSDVGVLHVFRHSCGVASSWSGCGSWGSCWARCRWCLLQPHFPYLGNEGIGGSGGVCLLCPSIVITEAHTLLKKSKNVLENTYVGICSFIHGLIYPLAETLFLQTDSVLGAEGTNTSKTGFPELLG